MKKSLKAREVFPKRSQEASDIGRTVDNAVGPNLEDLANRSTSAGADALAGAARTAQALAETFAGDSPALAEYVRGAGEKIDRLASDLRGKKAGDLLTSATQFGRSQPVIMLAGAALVGFALSRSIKAGVASTVVEAAPSEDLSEV